MSLENTNIQGLRTQILDNYRILQPNHNATVAILYKDTWHNILRNTLWTANLTENGKVVLETQSCARWPTPASALQALLRESGRQVAEKSGLAVDDQGDASSWFGFGVFVFGVVVGTAFAAQNACGC